MNKYMASVRFLGSCGGGFKEVSGYLFVEVVKEFNDDNYSSK